jgi:hypothetical protein
MVVLTGIEALVSVSSAIFSSYALVKRRCQRTGSCDVEPGGKRDLNFENHCFAKSQANIDTFPGLVMSRSTVGSLTPLEDCSWKFVRDEGGKSNRVESL